MGLRGSAQAPPGSGRAAVGWRARHPGGAASKEVTMPQPAKSSQALARTRRAFPLVLGACLVAFTCTASGSSAPPVPCNNPGVICGTAGPDTLTGTNGDDFIYGLGGDDTIHGLAGGDELYGGEGDDTV